MDTWPVTKGMNKDSGFTGLTPEKALTHVHNHHPHEPTYTHLQAEQHYQEHTSDWMAFSQVPASQLLSLSFEKKINWSSYKKMYALIRETILFECILKEHLEVTPQWKVFHCSLKWSRIIFRWNHKTVCTCKGIKAILKSWKEKNILKNTSQRGHEYFSESMLQLFFTIAWFCIYTYFIAFSKLFEFS